MDPGDGAVSHAAADPRIEASGSARFAADMIKATGKLHDRLTAVELRIGESLGVGVDDGKVGKLAARVSMLWKAAVFAISTAIVSLGAVASMVYGRGEVAGAVASRLTTLEHDLERISDQLRAVWAARLSPIPLPRPTEAP